MKIAYFAIVDASGENGVLKKIKDQINSWRSFGEDVKLFVYSYHEGVWEGMQDIPLEIVPALGTVKRRISIWKLARSILRWKPNCLYMRFCIYSPAIGLLLKNIPTILDINTDDIIESLEFKKYYYCYHILTRDIVFRSCVGIVSFSYQVEEYLSGYDKPIITIGNSIDLDRITPAQPFHNNKPNLVFMGSSGSIWHGVDKLLQLANVFSDWSIDVIGYDEIDFLKPVPKNMRFHGYLTENSYIEILKKADVAVASLAMHRLRLNDGSALKLREYLAYGLPVIIGYQDVDFLEKNNFILQLPNTPNNILVSYDSIREFVQNWMGKRVSRNEILHLDTKVKEKRRLEFISDITQLK